MKRTSLLFKNIIAFTLVLVSATFTGCTLSGIDGDLNSTVTEQDLEVASQILGESLSADNSGLILSMNDAVTTVSRSDFTDEGALAKSQNPPPELLDDSGRGRENNYSYSYDPETGIHTVSFKRIIDRPLFSKEVTDTLHYIFTDNSGAFIERPRAQQERIETINFNGHREGNVETSRRTSAFVRKDTLLINGVSAASPILQIDGVHNGNGNMRIERTNGDFLERFYQLEINFLNIEIDKELSQNGLEQGVTGTLSWEMNISRNNNGEESSKTIRGTIEMNGDGTALLRFRNFLQVFQINLNDGDVKDSDREFEGQVVSVDLNPGSFTLRSGQRIFVNGQTNIDDSDFSSLSEVQRALENEVLVWAEGDIKKNGNRYLAAEVEFKRQDDNNDNTPKNETREFEETVNSVNIPQKTFTIAGDVVVRITRDTKIENDGDLRSLQQVNAALAQGSSVKAEGTAILPENNSGADLVAVSVSFERNSDDGND